MSTRKLQYASLAVGVLLSITLIVNTALSTYVLYTSSFTASMAESPGEKLDIAISADVGRPSPLEFLWRALKSWTTAWFVGGQQRENATTAVTIQVTGSNVASTATVNWYIEAEDSGSAGTPYRFVEGNGTQVTVGGASHQASDQRSIESHLEAMGLSVDTSHTIDYYVYAQVQTTGAVSGETLTSEIVKTKFDTVTYTYGSVITQYHDLNTEGGTEDYYVDHNGYIDSQDFLRLRNNDRDPLIDDYSGLGARFTISNVPQGTQLTYAILRLRFYAAFDGTDRVIQYTADLQDDKIGSTNEWSTGMTLAGTKINVTLNDAAAQYVVSQDITELIQELVDRPEWGTTYTHFNLIVRDQSGAGDAEFWARDSGFTQRAPLLELQYTSYGASWYPVPPLSVIDLPISLDLMAYAAVAAAALAIYLSKKKEKKRR